MTRTSERPSPSVACVLVILAASLPAVAQELGPRVSVGAGSDPDVAVDSTGRLHVVYERGGDTYYRTVDYPDVVGDEIRVGVGDDPQVAVDSRNIPHVVMGAVDYARRDGLGFTGPRTIVNAWRKPRLAIDVLDRVYVTVSRSDSPRVLLSVIENDEIIAGPDPVGSDNNGAVDVDGSQVAHVTWRSSKVYHNTYTLAAGAGDSTSLHTSSDFSWCAVDLRNDSVHVVNTVSGGGGIHYRFLDGGWSDLQTLAVDEVSGVDDPDNVGPTIAVDRDGYKYVSFAGRGRVPYYFTVDSDGRASAIRRLDPENGSLSGGKFENPNVGAHSGRAGAYVAWGRSTVYVRSIALPAGPSDPPPPPSRLRVR